MSFRIGLLSDVKEKDKDKTMKGKDTMSTSTTPTTSILAGNRLRTFVNLFKQLKQWTDLVAIHCSPTDMFIQCLDRSNVGLNTNRLMSNWFDDYLCDESIIVAVRTDQLSKILDYALKDDVTRMDMSVSMENNDLLEIVLLGPGETQYFELHLCQYENEIVGVPDMEYDADITMCTEWFQSQFKKMEAFSETMHMECSESLISLRGVNDDDTKVRIDIPMEKLHGYEVIPDQTISGTFSMRYVNMCINHHMAAYLTLSLKENMPMRIRYCLDLEDESMISFYVAPKIVDEEDEPTPVPVPTNGKKRKSAETGAL